MPTSAAMPQSSGADGRGVPPHGLDFYHCPRCRWRYPNHRPSAKKRRNHKKYCGEIAARKSKGDQSSFAREIDGEETILAVPNDDRLHLESDIEGREESDSSMMSCMEEHNMLEKETSSSSINSISASFDLDMNGLESPQTKLMDETKETSPRTTENVEQNPLLHDHRVIADALASQSSTSNHTSLDILLAVIEDETQQRISLSCSQQTSEIYATNIAPQAQDMDVAESPPLNDGQISEVFARQSTKEIHTSLDCLLEAIDLIEVEEKKSLPCNPQSKDSHELISFINQIEVKDKSLLPSSQTSKEIYTANDKSMSSASPHANSMHESEAPPPNLKPTSGAEIQEENMEHSQPQSNFEINAATANQTGGKKIRTTLKSLFEENIEIEAEEKSSLPNSHTSLRSLLEKGISSPNRFPQVPECIGSRILTDDVSSEESCPLAVDGLAQKEWKTRKGRLNWMTFFCCASLR